MRILRILFVLGILAVGCVHVNSTKLNNNSAYAPTNPDDVVVYMTPADVKRPYEKVALINSSGSSVWTGEDSLIKGMREEAAKLGANGLIVGGLEDADAGAKVAGAIFGVGTNRHGQAMAIFVKTLPPLPGQ